MKTPDRSSASRRAGGNKTSGSGAGLYFEKGGCFDLKRTTISANQILDGGIGAGAFLGGEYVGGCSANMDGVLVYGNLGGVDLDTDNTSITDNLEVTGQWDLFGTVASPLIVPRTQNCDPHLGPLADNGGDTLTHALPAGSCALDQAPANQYNIADQRGAGYVAIYGSAGDIGAYEAQPGAVNGTCGSANGGLYTSSPPTADLCASGNPGALRRNDDNRFFKWTCGAQADCSALLGSKEWTITPSIAGNGAVQPDTPQVVVDAGKVEFAVVASAGSVFASYAYCGQTTSVDPDQAIVVLTSVSASCDVVFHFEPSPIAQNGVCGSDNGKTLTTTPTHFCNAGAPSLLGGSGPWQWSCARVNISGKAVACSANGNVVVPPAHNVTVSSGTGGSITPSGAQTVADGDALTLTLTPATGYVVAGVSGCGGHLAGNAYLTAPIVADCAVVATFVLANAPVNGVCGSDNGKTLSAAPVNLCTTGTPSTVLGAGPWSWTCRGGNGGTDAACIAQEGAIPMPTATTLNLAPNPAIVGQNVVATVVVDEVASALQSATQFGAAIGGNVSVSGGGRSCLASVVNGSAQCTLVFTVAGSYGITAGYAGDTTHAASSDVRTLTINAVDMNAVPVSAPAVDRWMELLTLLCLIAIAAHYKKWY